MIKNFSKFVNFLLMLSMCNTTFIACSEDDDDAGGSAGGGSTTSYGTVLGAGTGSLAPGLRYSTVDDSDFHYNADGSLDKITRLWGDDDYKATFSYNPFKIELLYENEVETTCKDFKFDKNGYVTSFKENYIEEDEDGTESVSNSYSLSYKDGYLVKIIGKSTAKISYDGVSWTATANAVMNCIWQGGNLKKCEIERTSKVAGQTMKYGSVYTFEYGDLDNNLQQHVVDASGPFILADMEFMPLLNMMGKPSAQFPVKMECEGYEMEDGIEEAHTYTLYFEDYTFNSDGTLYSYYAREKGYYGNTTRYWYETPDERTKSVDYGVAIDAATKKLNKKNHRWFKLPELTK